MCPSKDPFEGKIIWFQGSSSSTKSLPQRGLKDPRGFLGGKENEIPGVMILRKENEISGVISRKENEIPGGHHLEERERDSRGHLPLPIPYRLGNTESLPNPHRVFTKSLLSPYRDSRGYLPLPIRFREKEKESQMHLWHTDQHTIKEKAAYHSFVMPC